MGGGSIAQDQIKAFVDRILRLKKEVKAINADVREIYAEAKGSGFDKTNLGKLVNYVEKRQSDPSGVSEGEAIFDLYLEAYYGVGTFIATHTHETSGRDADGVFPDDEPQSETAVQMHVNEQSGATLDVDSTTSPDRVEGIVDGHPIKTTGSSNGRTAEFDSANAGSSPAPVSTEQQSVPQAASDLTVPQTSGQVATNTPEMANEVPNKPTDGGPHESAAHPVEPFDRRHDNDLNRQSAGGQTNEAVNTSAHIAAGEGAFIAPAAPLYAEPGEVVMESCPPVGIVAHPYAACWPVNTVDADGGVREPIVKSAQFILDGRGRYFAARRDGIEYPVVQYDGDDELADSIAWNLASRPGMSATALRIVAEKLAKLVPDRAEEIFERFGLGEAQEAAP